MLPEMFFHLILFLSPPLTRETDLTFCNTGAELRKSGWWKKEGEKNRATAAGFITGRRGQLNSSPALSQDEQAEAELSLAGGPGGPGPASSTGPIPALQRSL